MAVPKLKFDERFEERTDKEKIDYLIKLASSQNHALDMMQKERNALSQVAASLELKIKHADQALTIQKEAVSESILQSNEEKQQLYKQVQELQARVKAQDEVIEKLNADKE